MKRKTILRAFLALAGSSLLAISPASAATLTWDHDADGTASDGNGTWLGASSWLDGVTSVTWNNATPDSAIIGSGGSGAFTIDLTGGVTVADATFDNYTGKYRLSNGLLTVNGTLTWGPNTTASGTNDGVEFLNTSSLAGDGTIVVNGNYPEIKESGQFNIRTADVSAFTGTWNVRNGVLFTEGASVPSTSSNIILNGGPGANEGAVYSSRWSQTLTRNLGTADNQIQVIGNRSGFEGQGTNGLTVRLTDTGIGTQKVQWGSTDFDPSVLVLQTPNANPNGVVNFDTEVDLNGANRTVEVDIDHGNGIGNATWNDPSIQMSRPITNVLADGNGGLIKEGPGNLVLTATNTYDGGTTVNAGAVRYELAAAMPSTGTHAFNTGTQLQVRVGGGDDFTLAGTGAGTVDGLLSGTGPGTSTVTYTGDVDLMLRGGGTFAGNIPNLGGGGTTTDLWLVDGNFTLSGNNTFSGDLGVGRRAESARTLTLGSATALAGQPAKVVVDTSGASKLDLAGFDATVGEVQLGSNNGGVQGQIDDTVGGGTLTITGDVTLDGHNNGAGAIFVDTLDLNGGTRTFKLFGSNNASSSLTISSVIQNGAVIVDSTSNNGRVKFTGVNTYTGNTTVSDGVLSIDNPYLADSSDVFVATGAFIDLNFVGTDNINELWLGGVPQGPGVYDNTSPFITGTGTLTVSAGGGSLFETWAGGTGAGLGFDEDKNGDGVDNGLAFLLGAANPDADALGLLPTPTEDGSGGLVMTFSMLDSASRGTAALSVEHSGDLGITDAWASSLVPDSTSSVSGVDYVVSGSGTLSVVATIPAAGNAIAGKLFGRLKATE